MSRVASTSQRNLTLTEELEKLEQSITLTLQEIDYNFSKAHRIVTTSILPIVEDYAKHSKEVWEGSKFWKQFFEASANVSLSGYEEVPAEDETVTDTTGQATPSSASYASPGQEGYTQTSFTPTRSERHEASSPFETPSQTTPRAQRTQPKMAAYSSPYEALKREMLGTAGPAEEEISTSDLPSTPRGQTMDDSTPQSSPFLPPSEAPQRTPANDVLLHRVLDKNYRVLATPHGQPPLPKPRAQQPEPTPLTTRRTGARAQVNDDLDSSPLTAPQLRTEIFGTPGRVKRTPGVSVLTPARHKTPKQAVERGKQGKGVWDSDSDEDDMLEGMSPPKTMQFHIPQSKLLKTPAREASKKIIEDLLLTAGGDVTDDLEEDSPSVVKRVGLLEEDTF